MRPAPLVALISGVSAGIGEATARHLAKQGIHLAIGARRVEKVRQLAEELVAAHGIRVYAEALDVTDTQSAKAFVAGAAETLGGIHVLVNNAGLAHGMNKLEATEEWQWQGMLNTNVEGVLRLTQACLPHMRAAGWGHIVMLGSTAGHSVYEGGSIYCATKHAIKVFAQTLRLELCGEPIRISSVDPGMVYTDFSEVRLGSKEKAAKVYQGMTPLTADDIAECIRWVVELPDHVNIDEIIVKPLDQAQTYKVNRKG